MSFLPVRNKASKLFGTKRRRSRERRRDRYDEVDDNYSSAPAPPPYDHTPSRVTSLSSNENIPEVHRLIVGVDYGTTYTGVSWVTTGAGKTIDSVDIIRNWPGPSKAADVTYKTPSRIAYSFENNNMEKNHWGYQVGPKMKSYCWTKLLLYESKTEDGPQQRFDDPALVRGASRSDGAGVLKLPDSKSAHEVCTDFLTEVYKFTLELLTKRISKDVLDATPIEFWLSVPAIWDDRSKDTTRSIALGAGFGSRASDKVFLIPEPEAAAISTLAGLNQTGLEGLIKKGDCILICDCGGGTVDLTTYRVTATAPALKFDELAVGAGGTCGSTYVDRQFHAWMSKKFGKSFDNLPSEKIGPGSRLMKEFESLKLDFGSPSTPDEFEVTLNIPGVDDSEWYDSEENLVRFYRRDMESFFLPAITSIQGLIKQQLDQAKSKGNGAVISRILLVGGFGDSLHLKQELERWSSRHGTIQVICPKDPQAAIVKGAALRGLLGIKPDKRRCRRHYGFEVDMPFREGIDDEDKARISAWSGKKLCRDRVSWKIAKGQEIDEHTSATHAIFFTDEDSAEFRTTHSLFSSDLDTPPDWCSSAGVKTIGEIELNGTSIDLKKFSSKMVDGKKIWKFNYQIEILPSPKEGYLLFKATSNGHTCGEAHIVYEAE